MAVRSKKSQTLSNFGNFLLISFLEGGTCVRKRGHLTPVLWQQWPVQVWHLILYLKYIQLKTQLKY